MNLSDLEMRVAMEETMGGRRIGKKCALEVEECNRPGKRMRD